MMFVTLLSSYLLGISYIGTFIGYSLLCNGDIFTFISYSPSGIGYFYSFISYYLDIGYIRVFKHSPGFFLTFTLNKNRPTISCWSAFCLDLVFGFECSFHFAARFFFTHIVSFVVIFFTFTNTNQ